MTSETPENNVINIEDLKDIMDGDMELIHDCFTDFIQDFPGDFDSIKNAVIEKDGIKLDAAAHKLKGTLRYLAAEKAANAAYVLELAGKSNHMEGIEDKLETLNRECRKLLAFINGFKA
ncbi:MAG: Hpt domain-containing protein [Desulfobacteraceae bacterium]|nr:Hpt domain-containing protein [Desulfobacteraceae bacterium]